jgi:hypothetical protein
VTELAAWLAFALMCVALVSAVCLLVWTELKIRGRR